MAYQLPDPSPATFIETQRGFVPVGMECHDCSAVCFPNGSICRVCGSDNVVTTHLSPLGEVLGFTRIARDVEPIAVGEVLLADGVKVFGALIPAQDVVVGSRVRFMPIDTVMSFTIERDQ